MTFRQPHIVLLMIVLWLAPAGAARADSWVAPRQTIYYSANRAFRLIVTPHIPADGNAWSREELRGPFAPDRARAALQRLEGRTQWRTQWEGPLRNEIMPVGALVADSGQYFVTFDDWFTRGQGSNVVVIYGADGIPVRSYVLDEVVPIYMVDAFARSVSSVDWQAEGTRIEGGHLRVSIAEPGDVLHAPARAFFVDIDLATGSVLPITEADLARWRPRACALHRRVVASHNAYVQAERADLMAPASENGEAWESYGFQAATRLFSPNVPLVIPLPQARDQFYAMNLGSFRHFLVAPAEGGNPAANRRVFVAFRQSELVAETERAAAVLPRGRLAGVEMVIIADGAHWPRIRAALGPSGAVLRQVDPSAPIPQQPSRLADLPPERVVDPVCAE